MKECLIKIDGSVMDIIKFMVDNFNFIEVGKNGIQFTSDIKFGAAVSEMDDDAMRQLYGTDYIAPCKFLHVNINKRYDEIYDEDNDCYYDPDFDDRPYDLYSFKIKNYGDYLSMTKEFVNGEYFKPHTYVNDKIEFMNKFFKEFSNISRYTKDHKKLKDDAFIEFKVLVHDNPIELIKVWKEIYGLSVSMKYIDGNNGIIMDYFIFKDLSDDEIKPRVIDVNENPQDYITILLRNRLADVGLMGRSMAEMLYNMKDKLPFDLSDLAYNDNGRMKYSKTYGQILNMANSLAEADPYQLSRMYIMVCETYNKYVDEDKQTSYNVYINLNNESFM